METKQITLRSQTVQCQNCGEYYSVTYKYCPFCEYGKPEERPKGMAGGLLGGFLGSPEGKKPSGERHPPKSAESSHRREEEPGRKPKAAAPKKRSSGSGQAKPRPAGEEPKKKAVSGYAEWYASSEYEATRKRSGGSRKKTSEMSEAEKAAYQAEREARAAERKRERERIARAAAIGEMNSRFPALVPDEARPQPVAPVEGIVEAPIQQPVPVPKPNEQEEPQAVQEPPRQPEQEEVDPATLENIPLFVPEDLPEIVPVVSVGAAAPNSQEGTEEIQPEEQTVAEPQEQPVEAAEPESDLDVLLREIRKMLGEESLSEEPEMTPVQEEFAVQPEAAFVPEESVVQPEAADLSAPMGQEEPVADGEPFAASQEEDISVDQIMEEVRQGLLDMPVETTPVMVSSVYAEQPAQENAEGQPAYAEQPVQESAESQTSYAEQPVQESAKSQTPYAEQSAQEDAESQAVYAEQPFLDGNSQSDQEENPFLQMKREIDPALEKVFTASQPEPEILAASAGKKKKKRPPTQPVQTDKEKKSVETKKSIPILPIISLIVIVIAIFIVVQKVVPAFRTGILSGGAAQTEVVEDTAETFSLDQTELSFVEPGAKVTLVPMFEPEGSTAVLDWTCDNWSVAYLDADGTVTSLAPGEAVVTATMANGQSAQCQVHCAWDASAVPSETEPAKKEGPALAINDITLSEEGASKTLELVGAESAKWDTSNPSVATVDQNGVVTAVSKGSANVTAKVGDKTLICAVRCVW